MIKRLEPEADNKVPEVTTISFSNRGIKTFLNTIDWNKFSINTLYRGADKSLARPGRKQARKHVRDVRDFNNIETRVVIKFFFFLQGNTPKEIHAMLTET